MLINNWDLQIIRDPLLPKQMKMGQRGLLYTGNRYIKTYNVYLVRKAKNRNVAFGQACR